MLGMTNAPSPDSIKNSDLNISINGTNKLTYNGTEAKSLDITLTSLGGATAGHNHDAAYAAKSHSHSYLPLSGGKMTGNISMTGTTKIILPPNTFQIVLREEAATWASGIGYDTSSTECMAFMAKDPRTTFKFKCGFDPYTFVNGSFVNLAANLTISSAGIKTTGVVQGVQLLSEDSSGSMSIKPQSGNEVNFGGSNTSNTIYFGYRAVDQKPIPIKFIFGGAHPGHADILAGRYYQSGTLSCLPAIQSGAPITTMLWAW